MLLKIATKQLSIFKMSSQPIINKKFNIGEKDEVTCIEKIFDTISNNDLSTMVILFGNDADEGIELINPETTLPYESKSSIAKTKPSYKCDITLRMKKTNKIHNVSIKSIRGANPAFINHTPRSAKIFKVGGNLHSYVNMLDNIVGIIKTYRERKICTEDICISKLNLQKEEKDCLIQVMKYFMFEGTGKGYSKVKSNAILIVNSLNMNDWIFYDCCTDCAKTEYINKIYDNCIISLRNKGMPKNHISLEYCKPWIYTSDLNVMKGSIHIRMGKIDVL